MRHLYPAVFLAALATLAPGATAGAPLTITNYHLLSVTKQTRTVSLYTYSADLVNTGQGQPALTATVTSLVPSIVVQSGQGSLHFPPVAANGTVTSTNFFAVTVDRSGNADFANLSWAFSTPVANAGPAQTVPVGTTVTLDGSKSTNPSGVGTLAYSWAFATVNGRPAGSSAVIQNPTSVMPSFVTDTKGNYNIVLTASNGAGVDSASVTITTINSPPVADAGPNQGLNVGSTVTLNGTGSHDIDGDLLTYAWTLVTAPGGSLAALTGTTTVNPTFVADKVGTYQAQLVVNDGHANSAIAQVTITSNDVPPVADAGVSQSVSMGSQVQLDGSKSTDVSGNILTYRWSFNSIPSGSTATLNNPALVNPVFTVDVQGTYVIQLIVNDGFDDSLPVNVTVSTNAVLAPTAKPGSNQTVGHGGVVSLNGSGTDPQALPLTYQWSFTSIPANSTAVLVSPAAASTTFVADLPGSYTLQLIVSNGVLNSPPAMMTVTTINSAPVADAGALQNVSAGATVTLDGSLSSDADHDPLTYSWTFLSVPSGSATLLLSPNIVSPTFVADVGGTYVVQLIVSDPFAASSPVTVMVIATSSGISVTPSPLNLFLNATGTITVSIASPAGALGQAIRLAPIDPSVATVPLSVTIPANTTSTTAVVTPVGTGSTQIFASATGLQPGITTVNVTRPAITLALSNSNVGITKTVTGTITLSEPALPGGLTITLSADLGGILSFPLTVPIASGNTATFTITGVASGTATITASSPDYSSDSATVTGVSLGAISLDSGVNVVAGASVPFGVSLVSPAPVGGVTISLVSGDPTRLTVSPSVFIAGGATTPASPAQVTGVSLGTVAVTASAGGFTGASQNVIVVAGLLVTPASLAPGTVNIAYPQTAVSATGGTSPYVLSSINLPAGLSFNTTTGVLNGTPTAAGTATITVKDSAPTPLSTSLTLIINPPVLVLNPNPLPAGTAGSAYTAVTIVASGGTSPYVMSSAGLPSGLSFDTTTGILSGTPALAGLGTITVRDSATSPQTASLTVTIHPAPLVITPASLATGTGGVAYTSVTVGATGGTPPYVLSSMNLPTGLSFNTTTGVLSGTPTTAGVGTITVKDSAGTPQSGSLTVTILTPILTISPSPLPNGTAGVMYPSTTMGASGGTPPYTFSAVSLPAGLSLNAVTGLLSGTPGAAGTATITVKDSATIPQTSSVSLVIAPPPLVMSPLTLSNGTVGTAYPATTITASGGTGPYTLSAANLPTGLSFNAGTGVLSGTPGAAGTGTITAKDSATPFLTASVSVTIVASPLVVTPPVLPGGAVGAAYPATTVSASGGTPPYILSSSGLPTGLSFSTTTGLLNGTPMGSGTGTITVKDSATSPQIVTRSVTINSALVIAPASLAPGTVNIMYTQVTVSATGGTPPYILSSASLPAGMSLNTTTGVLSGTPTAYGTGTVIVTDSTSPVPLTNSLQLVINPAPLVLSPASLPNGAAGAVYPTTTVTATGGILPYILSKSNIPSGMNFDTTTGVLSGTPTTSGTGSVTVKDSSPTPLSNTLMFTINPPMVVSPASPLPAGAVGAPYPATTVSASGGTPPYVLSASGLPAGMAFSVSTGLLNGTPLASGSVVITVKDSTSPTPLMGTLSLTINPPIVISPASLLNGTVNVPYTPVTVGASGGTPPYILSVASLPGGMSFNTTTGALGGTPNATGTAVITVKDSTAGTPLSGTLSFTINPQLVILPASLPSGTSGVVYTSTTMSATGGQQPYTFSASGLPSGLSFNAGTGVISGTPSATGTGTITVHDSSSPSVLTASVTLTVNPGALTITTSSLTDGIATQSYSAAVAASGGTPPYNFSAVGLPGGLSIRTTGQITGVPASAGTSSVVVTVMDSAVSPLSTNVTLPLIIHPAPLVPSTASLTSGIIGTLYNQNLVATGGTVPYTWSIISGSLPSGLTLNPAGRIGGVPDGTGPQTTTVVLGVKDSGAPQLSAQTGTLTLTVSPPITTPYVTITDATVGQNLETTLAVGLNNFSGSANVTISSDNPSVVFSKFAGTVGTASLQVSGSVSSFIIYAQGLDASGTAHVTAHPAGQPTSADGTSVVTLSPSGFVVSGPNGIGASVLANQGAAIPLSVIAKQLDLSGNVVQTQQVRAGLTQVVGLTNLPAGAGTMPSFVTFTGGTDTVSVSFTAGTAVASATVTVTEPSPFVVPALNANMLAISVQQTQLTPANVTVGENLETNASVTLNTNVTSDLEVTLMSSDPSKVLLSTDPTLPGQQSIVMKIKAPSNHTQDFYVYGLTNSGTVGYTATATGFGTATGLVTLAPAGFVLESPSGMGADFFTVANTTTFLNVDSVTFDTSGNVTAQQAIAGGLSVDVSITDSLPSVGTVTSPITITGGNSSGSIQFNALGSGLTRLTATAPDGLGFSTGTASSLNANVRSPGILIDNGDSIGYNLEQQGTIFLGAPAPAGGAPVLLMVTSGSMQLSGNATDPGANSITVTIPQGQTIGSFFMYGRDSQGSATINASSSGYNSSVGTENLFPSGFIVTGPFGVGFGMTASVKTGAAPLTVSTAMLDSLFNYMNPQPLAPTADGLPVQVALSSTVITVGTCPPMAAISPGSSSTTVSFTPVAQGSTVIQATKTAGFFVVPNQYSRLSVTVSP